MSALCLRESADGAYLAIKLQLLASRHKTLFICGVRATEVERLLAL